MRLARAGGAVAAIARVPVAVGRLGRRVPLLRDPVGLVGGSVVVLLLTAAVMAPVLAPYDPLEIKQKYVLVAPGKQFWLGTDEFGRDVLTRLIYGARVSLGIGLASVAVGGIAGGVLGVLSGYAGGRVDTVIQRFVDLFMSLPSLVLALVLMATLGASISNVIIAVGVAMTPRLARVVRSSAISIRESDYVLAARAIGAGNMRIVLAHVLPNCMAPWLIITTAYLSKAILVEASLSFLGAGVPPPYPSWGSMLTNAKQFVEIGPWVAIFPGLAISAAVFGFNLFGDAIRDVLDPRLRGTTSASS